LVERNPEPVDRRRQRLALTAAGEQMLARLTASSRAELRRFRSELADVLHALGED
jgi:DNA-binding MarR family transcriptional regulator